MKKLISILFLAIFSLQSFSVDVLQYILSSNLNVEEIHNTHDGAKDGLQKGIKKEGFTDLLYAGLPFYLSNNLESGIHVIGSESFISNQYFEISVPPPNFVA